jgi:pre-mRNA-splicing factor CWC26
MSLADYLAKNYLTADTDKKSKKRKRKNKDGGAGLKIDEDDISGWNKPGGSDDDDGPTIAGMSLSKAKRKAKSAAAGGGGLANIKTFGVAAPSHAAQLAADQAAADAVIAATVADRQNADEAEDEAPEMVDTEGVFVEPGVKPGLQTSAQVAAAMKKKNEEEKREAAAAAKEAGATETIYRDASGRIINVAMKRAEARRKAEAEEQKKLDLERAARGDVRKA